MLVAGATTNVGAAFALTVRVAVRLVLLKLMLPVYVPDVRLFALELIAKVTVVPDLPTVPDVDEAVSQLGTLVIIYFTLPLAALSE